MKALLLLFLLGCYEWIFSQNTPPCSGKPPVSAISSGKSKRRINKYKDLKNIRLDSLSGKKEIDSILYSSDVFINLLQHLTDPAKDYDGFRVYIATYPNTQAGPSVPDSGYDHITYGHQDCFTLIYVPTTCGLTPARDTIHIDDLHSCYVIKGNTLDSIDAYSPGGAFLSQWIQKYRSRRMPFFAMDGNGYVNKGALSFTHQQRLFRETESIWYKGSEARNGTNGVLDYIRCSENHVVAVSANFAGYLLKGKPWSYKLTLVFGIQSTTNNLYGNKELFVSYSVQNSDTGKPCPPPNPCNTTVGSALPLNQ